MAFTPLSASTTHQCCNTLHLSASSPTLSFFISEMGSEHSQQLLRYALHHVPSIKLSSSRVFDVRLKKSKIIPTLQLPLAHSGPSLLHILWAMHSTSARKTRYVPCSRGLKSRQTRNKRRLTCLTSCVEGHAKTPTSLHHHTQLNFFLSPSLLPELIREGQPWILYWSQL